MGGAGQGRTHLHLKKDAIFNIKVLIYVNFSLLISLKFPLFIKSGIGNFRKTDMSLEKKDFHF